MRHPWLVLCWIASRERSGIDEINFTLHTSNSLTHHENGARSYERMRATRALLQHTLRLTLFTHDHCSLCHSVKGVMSRVWDRRHFDYREVDILAPENSRWKKLYEMDIPVVSVVGSLPWILAQGLAGPH